MQAKVELVMLINALGERATTHFRGSLNMMKVLNLFNTFTLFDIKEPILGGSSFCFIFTIQRKMIYTLFSAF